MSGQESSPAPAPSDAVTIVIPTLDRRELLLRTLRSVREQRDVDLQIIVVNDGGHDGSVDAVEALGDARVRVLSHEKPRGVSAARNAGLAEVTTPWVAFVDDDDLFAPHKLRTQLDALEASPVAGWSCVSSVFIDDRTRVRHWADAPRGSEFGDRLLAANEIPGGGSGVLVRTDLARKIGGYDESISNIADWDFYIRLGLASPLASVNRPLLAYYVHPGGMSFNARRSAKEYEYLADKYAAERTARGVELNRFEWTIYLATVAYRGRDRRWGVQLYAQAFQLRPSARLLLSVVRQMAPAKLREFKPLITGTTTPKGWAADLQWLEDYRP